MGNLRSVRNALEAAGAEVCVTSRSEDLQRAERIVLPGVGAFAQGMRNLEASGLVEALRTEVLDRGKPFLGICLGLQLLAREGRENGSRAGLGWLGGIVERLRVEGKGLKVPHVGWNEIEIVMDSPLFAGLGGAPSFYFVHSYHMVCDGDDTVAGTCDYGGPFTALVLKGNILGTQFHPEKSQTNGQRLLRNFIRWRS
ncbi:MAG: imidazole glycerol phosphate synthase subunit HisH [Candidatus Rokubacteria bacterium]|nr:imidazole glycerol phosphate synthase subunit HisH [Candidatus Rokubacteria bacterium]